VKDPDVTDALAQSLERRVRHLDPRADTDELFARIEQRAARQRRLLLGGLAIALVLGAAGGFLVGRSDEPATPNAVVALSDGVPRHADNSSPIEPKNVATATAAVDQAFHEAYDGTTPQSVSRSAIQWGDRIDPLRKETVAAIETQGYTADQLVGTTIRLLETTFVDRTHAVVHFTLNIPGHGDVIVDRAGYAVFNNGRWQVSLRTACDLLSLGGLRQQCPPLTH
jgi:hypothetical protein